MHVCCSANKRAKGTSLVRLQHCPVAALTLPRTARPCCLLPQRQFRHQTGPPQQPGHTQGTRAARCCSSLPPPYGAQRSKQAPMPPLLPPPLRVLWLHQGDPPAHALTEKLGACLGLPRHAVRTYSESCIDFGQGARGRRPCRRLRVPLCRRHSHRHRNRHRHSATAQASTA